MSKTFFDIVRGAPMTVNVMSHFVNEDIIEIKIADRVTVVTAEFKRMGAQENTLAPVNAIATQRTAPGPLLLSSSSQNKYRTKSGEVLARHALHTVLNLIALNWV